MDQRHWEAKTSGPPPPPSKPWREEVMHLDPLGPPPDTAEVALLAEALQDFDGIAHGETCLTFVRGCTLVLFPSGENDASWLFGAVLASPIGAVGWLPRAALRPRASSVWELVKNFDG